MRAMGWMIVIVGMLACGKAAPESAPAGDRPPTDLKKKVEDKVEAIAPAAAGKGAESTDFGVESAKITFQVTGMEQGTVVAWFSGHGKTVVLQKDMKKPMPEKKTIVWKDARTTMWGEGEKPYTTKMRAKDTELRLVSTLDPKQLEMAGYAKKPNEQIAGKDCEVWFHEGMNVTLWRWKGVELKYINGVAKKNPPTVVATEVVSPVEIPAEVMTPPGQ